MTIELRLVRDGKTIFSIPIHSSSEGADRGRLEMEDERAQIIANEITPITEAANGVRTNGGRKVKAKTAENDHKIDLYVRDHDMKSEDLTLLYNTLLEYPGTYQVFLHLLMPDKSETTIEISEQLKVASTPALVAAVQRLFGDRITVRA